MSRKEKLILIAVISILAMACSCNFGNYFSNLINAVSDTLENGGNETTQIIEPELSEQDPFPEVVPEEEDLEEQQSPVEEVPVGFSNPALLIRFPTRGWGGEEIGRNLTEMNSGELIQQVAAAPSGGLVAFVTSQKEYGLGLVSLYLLDMNTSEVSLITPLTNEKTTMDSYEEGDLGMEVREASIALSFENLTWSPNGDTLAFVGAQEGVFAQVYTYHVETGTLTRLFGGESHHYKPSWSPDGSYVVSASAFGFGTGAGFGMDAVWADRADGSDGRRLYDASDSSDEVIWGWFDQRTCVVSSVSMLAGYVHLRAIDLDTGTVAYDILGPSDFFGDAAIAEEFGTVLFDFPFSDMADFVEGETISRDGLYLWQQGVEGYTQLNDVIHWNSTVVWDGDMQCYYAKVPKRAVTEDFIQPYTPAGLIDNTKCPSIVSIAEEAPIFATSGSQYVWIANEWNNIFDPGLNWVPVGEYSETALAQGIITQALWHPEEDLLYFATGDQVYQAQGAQMTVGMVSNTIGETVLALHWILP